MPFRSFWSLWAAATTLCFITISYLSGYKPGVRQYEAVLQESAGLRDIVKSQEETLNNTVSHTDDGYPSSLSSLPHVGMQTFPSTARFKDDAVTGDCSTAPGADQTGATEIYEKLPMHLMTILCCTNDFAIFSDLAQQFPGYKIHDALERVRPDTRENHPDFELYRIRHEHQGLGQNIAKLKGDGGWDLDKWKFLPMVFEAYAMAPESTKWYVFMEADTSLSWSNLLQWLRGLNSEEAVYAGSPTDIGDTALAHGGSGFVISHTAIGKMVDARREEGAEPYDARWENATSDACCGDEILARALFEVGVNLTDAWPNFQGESLGTYRFNNEGWCQVALSFHHVEAHEVITMWDFQNRWVRQHGRSKSYLYKDVFYALIAQHISGNERRERWNNWSEDKQITSIRKKNKHEKLSENERKSLQTADGCEELCRETDDCVQWRFKTDNCQMGTDIRLGMMDLEEDSWTSGWLSDRIQSWVKELDESC